MLKISKSLLSGSTALLVLHLISTRDMYGYEIVGELEARSKNVFSLKEGTLYPVLHGLEKDGFVTSYLSMQQSGKQRKYYRITKKGGAALLQKKAEWKTFSSAVDHVIGEFCHAE
ncbi:MAG: PadR family transcriptional regulator [Eubacteriales bacterium]|nr:PadR family transcriptional regulator [Eubacteriales bacterium]